MVKSKAQASLTAVHPQQQSGRSHNTCTPADKKHHPSAAWQKRKQTVLKTHKQPNGSEIVTSFTSHYQRWAPARAVRELWRIFKERLTSTLGVMEYTRDPNIAGRYLAIDSKGKYVGLVDCSKTDELRFVQKECILTADHFPEDDLKREVNQEGIDERFLAGVNALLSGGFSVKCVMPMQIWRFSHKSVFSPDVRNMCVRFFDSEDCDVLSTTIKGNEADRLFDPTIDIELIEGLELLGRATDGSIYSHSSLGGNIYCKGLFVNCYPHFQPLSMVLDLNVPSSEDRDLETLEVCSIFDRIAHDCLRDAAPNSKLFTSLKNLCYRLSSDQVSHITSVISTPLSSFIAAHHPASPEEGKLNADRTPGMSEPEHFGEGITQNTVLSSMNDPEQNRNKERLMKLVSSLSLTLGVDFELVVKDIPSPDICLPSVNASDRTITIDRQQNLSDTNAMLTTVQMITLIVNAATKHVFFRELSRLSLDFIRDSDAFEVRGYSSPKNFQLESGSSCEDKTEETALIEFIIPKAITDNSFQPETMTHLKFMTEIGAEFSACDTTFTETPLPEMMGNRLIFVDPVLVNSLIRDVQLSELVFIGSLVLDELIPSIAKALETAEENIPVMMVIVPQNVVSFARKGGICVNILALKDLSIRAVRRSIFFTVIHAITHRSVEPHDLEFADLMARLVFQCRMVI